MTQDTAQSTTTFGGVSDLSHGWSFEVTETQGRDYQKRITHTVIVRDPKTGYEASFTSTNGQATIIGHVAKRNADGDKVSLADGLGFGAYVRDVGWRKDFPDPRKVAVESIRARRRELEVQIHLLEAVEHYVEELPAKHLVWKEEPHVTAKRAALEAYTRYVTEHAADAKVASSTLVYNARRAAQDAAASVLPKRTPRRHVAEYGEHAERAFRSLREADPRDLERDHVVAPAWVTTSKGRPAYGDSGFGPDKASVERTRVRVVRAENTDIAVYVAALLDHHTAEMHSTRELHRGWERATVELAPAGWDAEDGIVHQQGDTTVKRITAEDVETGQKVTVNVSTDFAALYADRR